MIIAMKLLLLFLLSCSKPDPIQQNMTRKIVGRNADKKPQAVQIAIGTKKVQKNGRTFLKKGKSYNNKGIRKLVITFSCGTKIEIFSTYYSRKGAAGKRGKGCYPELLIVGIHCHCTKNLISLISCAAIALGSYEEA